MYRRLVAHPGDRVRVNGFLISRSAVSVVHPHHQHAMRRTPGAEVGFTPPVDGGVLPAGPVRVEGVWDGAGVTDAIVSPATGPLAIGVRCASGRPPSEDDSVAGLLPAHETATLLGSGSSHEALLLVALTLTDALAAELETCEVAVDVYVAVVPKSFDAEDCAELITGTPPTTPHVYRQPWMSREPDPEEWWAETRRVLDQEP